MVIDRYYGFVKRHSYDSIKTIVTPDFFGKSDSKEMISILEKMQNDFGDIIEADCENSKYEYFFTGGKQENRIELTYKVKYANNHFNTDVFTFKFNSNFNGKIYGIRFVQWEVNNL